MRLCLLLLMTCSIIEIDAQPDLRHMQYNLTLFGNPFGCDESTNNTSDKEAWLAEIVDYALPDVLCVNELADSDYYADRLLDNALNVNGQTMWARAELTDFATPSSIINGFYYRADKFTLYSQSYINQALDGSYLLRPTDLYTVYPSQTTADTTFITFVVVHLAASDADERADQTEATMAEIVERGFENVIFCGDLNIDSSSEEAFQNLLFPPDPGYALNDPVNSLGTWHNNGLYSDYHTQSTRFNDTNSGCFAPGGLDDRFDMTLITDDVLDGENGMTYVPGSYRVLGQNGNSYNAELPTIGNGDVPDDIANALYELSDHLPVITEYDIAGIVGISENPGLPIHVVNPMREYLSIIGQEEGVLAIELLDLSGRMVLSVSLDNDGPIDVSTLTPGIYLLRLTDLDERRSVRRVMKE